MIIDQLNNFFKEGKYESLIQFLNSTSYKEIDRNSINVIFLKFHSLLYSGYYIILRDELEKSFLNFNNISVLDQIKLNFLKCEVYNYLMDFKKGMSIIDELYSLIENNNIPKGEKNLLTLKTNVYKLQLSPFDEIYENCLDNSNLFKQYSSNHDNEFLNYLPDYYLKMALVMRKRKEILEANIYLEKSLELVSNNKYITAQVHLQIGLINISNQFFDKAIKNFEKSIELLKELNNLNRILESTTLLSSCYIRNGELNLAEDIILQSMNYYKPIYEDLFSTMLLEQLGDVYFFKGQLKTAFFDCYHKAEKKYIEYSLTRYLNDFFIKIARLKASEGNFDESKLYINKTISNFKADNDQDNENRTKIYLGNALFEMGNYDEAFELWKEIEQYFKNRNDKRYFALTNLNIGRYCLIFDVTNAINSYQENIKIFSNLKLVEGLIESYLGYSIALEEKGKEYLDEENIIFYKTKELIANLRGNYLYLAQGIYRLCLLSIENSLGKTKMYIDLTLNLHEKIPSNARSNQEIKFLKALKLKSIMRLKEQAKSLELFEEIVKEELMDYQTTLLAYLNILEFKIFELKFSNNSEILLEANHILENLFSLTSTNKLSAWSVKTLALKAQINLLELKFDDAKRNINDAIDIAKKKNMKRLLISLNNQYDDILSKITQLKLLNEGNNSLSDRLKITDFLIFGKNKLNITEIPEEEPAYISIIDSTGLSIYSHNFFRSTTEGFDQLMSGFLIAINSIILNLFSSSGFLERIKHKEFTIMIFQLKSNLYFCYVFKGPSYHAQEKVDTIQSEFVQSQILNTILESSKNKKTLNKIEIDLIESMLEKYFSLRNDL